MDKRAYVKFLALAFELAALVVTFLYAGRYIDQKFDFGGLGTAGGAGLALAVWITHLVSVVKTDGSNHEDGP